jgi:hypothetical protein
MHIVGQSFLLSSVFLLFTLSAEMCQARLLYRYQISRIQPYKLLMNAYLLDKPIAYCLRGMQIVPWNLIW